MKYCHDCLTPINSNSKEEYCTICKKDRGSITHLDIDRSKKV